MQSEEGTGEAQMECARVFQCKARLIPLGMGKVCMGLITQWGTQRSSRSGWVSGEKKNMGVREGYRQKERWETVYNALLDVSTCCFIPHNQTSSEVRACVSPI